MTRIYNMSAGFLLAYMEHVGKDDIDLQEEFKRLSYEMGGDGKTITKDQLDNYIKKADAGLIDVDKTKLKALKRIQNNWDNIANGDNTLTFEEMKKYAALLLATLNGTFTATEIEENEEKSSLKDAIFDYLTDYLGLSDKEEVQESDLTAYLNELISDKTSTEDGTNDELIGTLTNLIATYNSDFTIETEA